MMIHYNWGTIKYELKANKLFISKEGIDDFIRKIFGVTYKAPIISNFFKEIESSPIDKRESRLANFIVYLSFVTV